MIILPLLYSHGILTFHGFNPFIRNFEGGSNHIIPTASPDITNYCDTQKPWNTPVKKNHNNLVHNWWSKWMLGTITVSKLANHSMVKVQFCTKQQKFAQLKLCTKGFVHNCVHLIKVWREIDIVRSLQLLLMRMNQQLSLWEGVILFSFRPARITWGRKR